MVRTILYIFCGKRLRLLQLKRIPPRVGYKAALRDPGVEVDASGKAISNEGFQEITEALAQALSHSIQDEEIMRLEEICFRGNKLTARSLGLLAPVIELSAGALQDLNLANNKIQLETSEDTNHFEMFLLALSKCTALRKVDLSGNPLRSKGYEILSKTYATQGASATRGLHSIPYLILSNTGVDDTSALHLSYMIVHHGFPELLLSSVPPVKAGAQAQLLEGYDSIRGCRGVVYKPNPELGNAGARVLELAEQVRERNYEASEQNNEAEAMAAPSMKQLSLFENVQQPLTPETGRRRSSTGAVAFCSPGLRSRELDRARSRIQGDTLKEQGLASNDLWWAAMRMLKYARTTLLQTGPLRTDWAAHAGQTPVKEGGSSEPKLEAGLRHFSSPTRTRCDPEAFPRLPGSAIPSAATAKKPLSSGNPNAPILPRRTPSVKNTHNTPCGPITFHNGPLSRVRAEDVPLPPSPAASRTAPERTKDTVSLPYGLPEEVWTRILATAGGADGLLSPSQQRAVVRWAMDKRTLGEEMGALGKSESQQIWRVLHGMGCLAYGDEDPPALTQNAK